jgi:hypothetical protein
MCIGAALAGSAAASKSLATLTAEEPGWREVVDVLLRELRDVERFPELLDKIEALAAWMMGNSGT